MKKALLTAAILTGFSGAAVAESSVTLYGLVDAGYGFTQTKVKQGGETTRVRTTGAQDGVLNGSRWGLKGTEDLGNGTSAIFLLESGFNVTNGHSEQNGRLFGRQAYVGLSSDSWGTFTLGRQYNMADHFVSGIDPFETGGGLASATSTFGDSLSHRNDSSIKYLSPNFEGFQFGVGLVHEDSQTKYDPFIDPSNPSGQTQKEYDKSLGGTAGVSYSSGPLYIGASFDYLRTKNRAHDPSSPDAVYNGFVKSTANTKAWNIGMTYDFDVAKLHLMYGGQRDGVIGSAGYIQDIGYTMFNQGSVDAAFGEGFRQHSWLVGVSAPVNESGTIMASYQGSYMKNTKLKSIFPDNGNFPKTRNFRKANFNTFSLGYKHDLSKRTSVYALGSYGWSKGKYEKNTYSKAKVTSAQATIGLQHRF